LIHNNENVTFPADEKHLFSLVSEGDEKAFNVLFNLFLPRLYPYIIKLTRSETAAQEVIQETFIRVWLSRDKLAEIDNPTGWLLKVASNECYTHMRKSALNSRLPNHLSRPTMINNAQELLDTKEIKQLVEEAVSALPPQRRKIYRMSRDQGKSIPEIASELQISPNTVKNALVISLKFIREHLARSGVMVSLLSLLFWRK